MTFHIESGDLDAKIKADSLTEAVLIALKDHKPQTLGVLMSAYWWPHAPGKRGRSETYYIHTQMFLEKHGLWKT